jgi:hypothetical protein
LNRRRINLIIFAYSAFPFSVLIIHIFIYWQAGYRDNATDYIYVFLTICTNVAFIVSHSFALLIC